MRPSGVSKCDEKSPLPESDSGVISDSSKLPILGITYGNLHEYGSAEVIIGPLTCSSGKFYIGIWLVR